MKFSVKILLTAFLFFSIYSNSYSQLEEHYNSCTINASVPIKINWQKTIHKKDKGKIVSTIEKDDPGKDGYPQINLRVDDLKVTGNSFSGMETVNFPVYDELKTFYGEVSADKKKINFIEITYNQTKYSLPDRSKARLEEKIKMKFRFENVPLGLGGYVFKNGVTKITEVSYNKWRHLEYRGQNETYTEDFVSIDNDRITKWTSCIRVNFKPGKTKVDDDKNEVLAVFAEDKENILNRFKDENVINSEGIAALLTADFSKIPGLKIVQRMKLNKILQEIELSKSGIVDPETKVEDRRIDFDVLVYVTFEESLQNDSSSFIIRAIIQDISTGKVADPGLVFQYDPSDPAKTVASENFRAYLEKIVSFTQRYFLF